MAGTVAVVDLSEVHRRLYDETYLHLYNTDSPQSRNFHSALVTTKTKRLCYEVLDYVLENYRRGQWDEAVIRQYIMLADPLLVEDLIDFLPNKVHEILDAELNPPDSDPVLLKKIEGRFMKFLFLPRSYRDESIYNEHGADLSFD